MGSYACIEAVLHLLDQGQPVHDEWKWCSERDNERQIHRCRRRKPLAAGRNRPGKLLTFSQRESRGFGHPPLLKRDGSHTMLPIKRLHEAHTQRTKTSRTVKNQGEAAW